MEGNNVEVSLVIPCLNESDTLESCLRKARQGLERCGSGTEIIVADNGSNDNSVLIAERNGARVVAVGERGYGSALMGGIAAARGRFIIIGDADESHDLREIPKFVERLRDGWDLAQGCRMPAGGGTILPGSMSFLRRKIGNPLLSFIVRSWFRVPVHDVNCGFRAFRTELYDRLDQRCTGMEFAPEMIVKASFLKARIIEVPIVHHSDGRVSQPPHNRAIRDGWRTLRFFLMYSPRWLFLVPGTALVSLGMILYFLALFGVLSWDVRTNLQATVFAGLSIICGYQSILFSVFTKVFATREGLLATDERFERLFEIVNLERGLVLSAVSLAGGAVALLLGQMRSSLWGLDGLHFTLLGSTAIAVGFQTLLSGFFLSILGLKRK